jgi:hypothetical protein
MLPAMRSATPLTMVSMRVKMRAARYYGDDFVVDETLWHGEILDGSVFLCDGKSGKVSFRLLHIFEFQEGKIAREQAWCDLAALQQQLGVKLG